LKPTDLLNLARTSRPLRLFLLNKDKAHQIWTQAFKNVDTVPSCPLDLAEPAYASLCFDSTCHVGVATLYIPRAF
ncbi:hypothetical protein DFH09DRAFT_924927, partial [Mycena vulgaris]